MCTVSPALGDKKMADKSKREEEEEEEEGVITYLGNVPVDEEFIANLGRYSSRED